MPHQIENVQQAYLTRLICMNLFKFKTMIRTYQRNYGKCALAKVALQETFFFSGSKVGKGQLMTLLECYRSYTALTQSNPPSPRADVSNTVSHPVEILSTETTAAQPPRAENTTAETIVTENNPRSDDYAAPEKKLERLILAAEVSHKCILIFEML